MADAPTEKMTTGDVRSPEGLASSGILLVWTARELQPISSVAVNTLDSPAAAAAAAARQTPSVPFNKFMPFGRPFHLLEECRVV